MQYFRLFLLIPLVFLGFHSRAQTDSSSTELKPHADYFVNFSGFLQRGVANTTILSGKSGVSVGNKNYVAKLAASYAYGLYTGGFLGQNDLISRFVLTFKPENRFFYGIGYDFEFSAMYHVRFRSAPGAGVGYRFIRTKRNRLILNAFGTVETTDFKSFGQPDYTTVRANAVVIGSHQIIPNHVSFEYEVFFFQSVDDLANWRFRAHPSLEFKISRLLDFTVSYDYHYETVVDPRNKRENFFLTFGIELSRPRQVKN